MKYLIALPFLLTLSISIPTKAQDSSSVESFEVLEISGTIAINEKGMEDVLVELYEGNRVVDSFETKKNGKFKFTLFSNMIYTIQLSKEGHYTKRISVSTKVPDAYDDFSKFQFDIEMMVKEGTDYDENVAEYPSALISFDEKKREFTFDKAYTKSYFDEISKP